MNYVNLTSYNFNFRNFFKEVDINEKARIDAIIADLDSICKAESINNDEAGRNQIYNRFFELCTIGGQQFILLTASEDILYSESNEFQEVISWIQRTTHYQFEIRGVCSQSFKKEQQIEQFVYFILFYPPNSRIIFNDFDNIYCEKNYNINNSKNKYNYIRDYIVAKIEENLL